MHLDVLALQSPLELDDRAKESLYAFAYTMLHGEQLATAVHAFRVFVRCAPTDERGWLGLGACHEKLDQLDIAAELFGAGAMVSSPTSARCLLAFAQVSEDRGAAFEALTQAAQAAEMNGDDATLRLAEQQRGRW